MLASRCCSRRASLSYATCAAVKPDTATAQLTNNFFINKGLVVSATMMGAMFAGLEMAAPHASQAVDLADVVGNVPSPAFDLASDTPIWENIVRYAQYFFSVMLGTGYVMLKPFANLLKNPVSAIFLIAGVAGFAYFVNFTVKAMLGLDEPFEYVASSPVTNFLSE